MEQIIRSNNNTVAMIERDGKNFISGYGAVVYQGKAGQEYQIGDNLFERFAAGAFDRAVAEGQDIKCRYNHDDNFVLGSVASNTALVRVDSNGIRYDVPFDSTDPDHTKVKSKLEKGIIRGSSIKAHGVKYQFTEENGKHIAWVTNLEVIEDVGPVNNPAYKAAPAMMRSEQLDGQYSEWLRLKAETDKRLQRLNNER